MAATTADLNTLQAGTPIEETHPIANGEKLYIGALVEFAATTGRLKNAAPAAGARFAGIVTWLPDGSATGDSTGTVRARIAYGHLVEMDVLAAARDDDFLGTNVYAKTNREVTAKDDGGANATKVGTLCSWTRSDRSKGMVHLRVYAPTDADETPGT